MKQRIEHHLHSRFGKYFLNTAGILYFLVLGMEYTPLVNNKIGPQLLLAENILNGIFFIELALRVYVYRGDFFKKMFAIKLPPKKIPQTDEPVA